MKVPESVAHLLESRGQPVPAELDEAVVASFRSRIDHNAYSHLSEAEAANIACYMAASFQRHPSRKRTDPNHERLVDPRLSSRIDGVESQVVVLTTEILPKLRGDISEEIRQLQTNLEQLDTRYVKDDEFSAVAETLLRRINQLEARLHRQLEWIDTMSSPLYKRIWWWLCGWRWRTLGRWYGSDTKRWPPVSR